MKLSTFQKVSARTMNPAHDRRTAIDEYGLGAWTEAGEACDCLKKVYFHDRPLNEVSFVEEMGDSLWYLAASATTAGLSLEVCYRQEAGLAGQIGSYDYLQCIRQMLRGLSDLQDVLRGRDERMIVHCLGRLLHLYEHLLVLHGHSLEEVLVANVAKLRRRYPGETRAYLPHAEAATGSAERRSNVSEYDTKKKNVA